MHGACWSLRHFAQAKLPWRAGRFSKHPTTDKKHASISAFYYLSFLKRKSVYQTLHDARFLSLTLSANVENAYFLERSLHKNIHVSLLKTKIMAKGGSKGGSSSKGGNPNYPSTTGNKSGGGRGNVPKGK
jgi:hypothetical protein